MAEAEELDTRSPRSVARWAAARVYAECSGPHALWVRVTAIDGPGFMLTGVKTQPKSGLWTKVALIDEEDAARIAQRGHRGWPALCRLAEKIEEQLVAQGVDVRV